MIKNRYCLQTNDPLFLSVVLKLEFPQQLFEDTQISNFMIIRPVGVTLLRADRRTGLTKLIIVFRNFANPFKNTVLCSILPEPSHLIQ
jgi:hypothetical protein